MKDPAPDQKKEIDPLLRVDVGAPAQLRKAELKDINVGDTLFGRYQIVAKLGEGGMGVVCKARDLMLDRVVALKLLKPGPLLDDIGMARMQQEARAASALDHPGVARVYDFSIHQSGMAHMTMELVEGTSLAEMLIRQGRLPLDRAMDITIQAAEAIAHAHEKGIVHRDLKPSNLLICESLNQDRVKIVDFGIAKSLAPKEGVQAHLTQTGEIFGSPMYMSPEQCSGQKVDTRSDTYSLACVLFEMLTGRPPFVGDNTLQLLMQHVHEPAPRLKTMCPDKVFPEDLQHVLDKAMEKSPGQRYVAVSKFGEDLERVKVGERLAMMGSRGIEDWGLDRFLVIGMVLLMVPIVIYAIYASQLFRVNDSRAARNESATENTRFQPYVGEAISEYVKENRLKSKIGFEGVSVLSDEDLLLLRSMPNLKTLELSGSAILSCEGLRNLAGLDIEEINLSNAHSLEEKNLHYLDKLPRLRSLNLGNNPRITDQALAAIANCKSLKILTLNRTNVTDVGLQKLALLDQLEELSLTGCSNITDEGISALTKLKHLRNLVLQGTQISDTRILTRIPSLTTLDLSNTRVKPKSLMQLKSLKGLRTLTLVVDRNVNKEQMERLQIELPACNIILVKNEMSEESVPPDVSEVLRPR